MECWFKDTTFCPDWNMLLGKFYLCAFIFFLAFHQVWVSLCFFPFLLQLHRLKLRWAWFPPGGCWGAQFPRLFQLLKADRTACFTAPLSPSPVSNDAHLWFFLQPHAPSDSLLSPSSALKDPSDDDTGYTCTVQDTLPIISQLTGNLNSLFSVTWQESHFLVTRMWRPLAAHHSASHTL